MNPSKKDLLEEGVHRAQGSGVTWTAWGNKTLTEEAYARGLDCSCKKGIPFVSTEWTSRLVNVEKARRICEGTILFYHAEEQRSAYSLLQLDYV